MAIKVPKGVYFEDFFRNGKFRVLSTEEIARVLPNFYNANGPFQALGNIITSRTLFNSLPKRPAYKPTKDAAPIGKIIDWSQIGYAGAAGQPIPIFRGGGRFVGQLFWAGSSTATSTTKSLGKYWDLRWNVYTGWIDDPTYKDPKAAEYEAIYGPLGYNNPNYKLVYHPADPDFPDDFPAYYEYFVNLRAGNAVFAVAFARNLFGKTLYLNKLYADDQLIYNGATEETFNGVVIQFYDGLANTVDPTMESYDGDGNTPKYKQLVYVVFESFDPYKFNFTVPTISAQISEQENSGAVQRNLDMSYWVAQNEIFPDEFEDTANTWALTYNNDTFGDGDAYAVAIAHVVRRNYSLDLSIGYAYEGVEFASADSGIVPPDYDFSGLPFPYIDDTYYPTVPPISKAGWALFYNIPEATTTSDDALLHGMFIYQPKDPDYPDYPRAYATTIAAGHPYFLSNYVEWVELDQTGSVEETPNQCFLATTQTGNNRRVLIVSNKGPNNLIAYGIKWGLYSGGAYPNYYDPSTVPFTETREEGFINTGHTVTCFCMGPVSTSTGCLLYTRSGSNEIVKVSYTTGSSDWNFTPSVWGVQDSSNPTGVWYDASTDLVAISREDYKCYIYDFNDDDNPVRQVALPSGFRIAGHQPRTSTSIDGSSFIRREIYCDDGYCFLVNADNTEYRKLNLSTGEVTYYITLDPTYTDQWNSIVLAMHSGRAHQMIKAWSSLFTNTPQLVPVMYYAGNGGLPALYIEDLLTSLATKAGFPEGELEFVGTSALYCYGWALYNDADWRSVISGICEFYNIMVCDVGESLRFVKAGTDSDYTAADGEILAADLVDTGDAGQLITAYRLAEFDRPLSMEVTYANPFNDFSDAVQLAQRPNAYYNVTASKARYSVSAPVMLDDDTAVKRAYDLLYSSAAGAERHNFVSWSKNVKYEPGDVVTIPIDDGTRTIQLEEVVVNPDFTIEMSGREYLADRDTDATGATIIPPPRPTAPAGNTGTQLIVLDMALPSNSYGSTGASVIYFMTGSGVGTQWAGATLYQRTGSDPYTSFATTSGPAFPPVFRALTVPADTTQYWSLDTVYTIDIVLNDGDASGLTSCTFQEMLSGTNWFVYGDQTRWEIIAAQTITALGANKYRLSNLLRGLRGTEVFIYDHQISDYVIPLDLVYSYEYPQSYISGGTEVDVKIVGAGQTVDGVTAGTYVFGGYSLIPYAPFQLNAVLQSGGDIALTWEYRSRFAPQKPFWQPPITDAPESYVVEIINNAASPPVIRTYNPVAARTKTYTAAHQTTDWGAPLTAGTSLTFRVYAISATPVGYGYYWENTITL